MSKCTIFIELTKTTFSPGEEIQGALLLRVLEPFNCNGLSIHLEWYTTGKGDNHTQKVETKKLFQGEYQKAGEQRYPFSFQAPKGPFTYTGKILTAEWRIRAEADISWATDPSASAAFILAPAPTMSSAEPYYYGSPQNQKDASKDPNSLSSPTGGPAAPLLPLWAWVLLAPLLLYLAGAMLIAAPFLLLLLSPLFLYYGIKHWMIASRVGKPETTLSKRVVCRGESVSIQVKFTAQKKVSFGKIFAALDCQEVAIKSHGKSSTTHKEAVYSYEVPLLVEEEIPQLDAYRDAPDQKRQVTVQGAKGGESYLFRATLPIGAEVPFTLSAPRNSLVNKIIVSIEMPDWPDWKEEIPITVRPGTPPKSEG